MRSRLVIPALVAVAALAGAIGPAQSAFPGANGKIVFTSDRHGGEAELYTIDSANAVDRLTTSGPGANPVESPAWSPDGNRIAFARDGGIFSFDTGDSTVSPVTDPNMGPFDFGQPAWSPDGTMLAVTRGAAGVQGIWRVRPDGSDLIRLTSREDRDPAWSPDGGTIAFTRAGVAFGEVGSAAGEDLYLMNPDGSGQVRLTVSGGATDPAWSPDGSEIAFVDRFNEQTDISVLDVDDPEAGLRQVTSTSDREFHPAWSPDGTKIVYEKGSVGGQGNELFVANADGSGGETPRTNGASDRWPDWQPLSAPAGADATCSIANTRVDEGNGGSADASFEVDCDNPASDTYSVAYATADGTAGEPDDYMSANGSFDVPPGTSHRQIHVDVTGESAPELHETFTITLSSGPVMIQRPTATATIVDDDGFSVTVETASVLEGDSGSTDVELGISLSAAAIQPVPVALVVRSQSAFPGQDYEWPSTVLTFDPGEVEKVVTIRVFGDVEFEGDQKVEILPVSRLIRDANSVDGGLWIRDDDVDAALTIDDVSVAEGDSGTAMATFTVTRSELSGAVAFDFATESGSATAADDYVATHDRRSFPAGSLTATVEVPVRGDVFDEPHERFRVRLSNPSKAIIADSEAVGTITDDDPAPSLSIGDVSVAEGNTGTATASFTVSLSNPSGKTVTVDYATADGSASAPGDYTAIATTPLSFAPGTATRTVEVEVKGDTAFEGPETFTVALTNAQNAAIGDGQGVGTILDDEAPANDDFANAAALAAGPTPFDTSFASVEAGEPGIEADEPEGHPSLWYRLSPGRGGVLLQADSDLGLAQAKRLSVYTGTSLGGLTLLARRESPGAPFDFGYVDLSFPTVDGREYYVQVIGPSVLPHDGQPGSAPGIGRGTLSMTFYPAPANDDFADAAPLPTGTTSFDTSFASVQAGEPGLEAPEPEGFPSVWYRLSPGAGVVRLHAESAPGLGTPQAKRLSVYTGTSLGGLTLVARHESDQFPSRPLGPGIVEFEFPTAAAQQYYVQVVGPSAIPHDGQPGFGPGGGEGTLSMAFHAAPGNDDFADAAPLTAGTTPFDASFASVETDEPGLEASEPGRFPSIWYRLNPGSGGLVLNAESAGLGTPQAMRVSVYTGTSIDGLTLLARRETNGAPFDGGAVDLELPTADGRQYYVQVIGPSALRHDGVGPFRPGIGQGTLSMVFHPAPANDDFADAAPLPTGTTSFDTSFASVQTGEPGLAATAPEGFPSVWYRLSSPGLGTTTLRAGAGAVIGRPRQLSVYALGAQGALTLVTRSSAPNPFPGAAGDPINASVDVEFRTICGATYYVQVLGPSAFPHTGQNVFDPTAGQGTLSTQRQPLPEPTNDAFADAPTLGGGRTTLSDDWWTCTSAEPGEPAHGGAPAAHSIWYRTTVASGRVTVDSPGNRVAVYQGTNIGALARIADGSTGKASFLTPGGTYLVAVDGGSGTTVDLELTPGEVVTTPSGALTTDNEGQPPDGATASDPIETTLGGGAAGRKTIFETQGPTPPSAWTFLGWKVEIEAPPSTPSIPYTITFRIDPSLLVGVTGQLEVFRNGVVVPNCNPQPAPDPCVFSRTASAGDQIIIVRTSRASEWTFGTPRTTRGTALGLLQPSAGGDAEFLVASNGTTVAGAFSYGRGGERFVATKVNALAIGGNKAWLAGVGRDGRTFLAYVEDNGPGSSDRFRLWIGGSERTDPDGRLRSGSIVIRP